MTIEKKLSDEIQGYAEAVRSGFEDVVADTWVDRARALEERVAELADELQQSGADLYSALARAEAAEAALAEERERVRDVAQKEIDFCDEHGGHPSTVATDILAIPQQGRQR